jgi:hypothetical protein
LADRLVEIEPNNPRYRRESAAADSNLCVVALAQSQHTDDAIQICSSALAKTTQLAGRSKPDTDVSNDIINMHAWLADAYYLKGDLAHAKAERLSEELLVDAQIASDPRNMELKDTWITTQRALALIESQSGDKDAAKARLNRSLTVVQAMVRFDPKNQSWAKDRNSIERSLESLH